MRLNWAVSLPPSPCHGKNGSANARSSPFNALNKVVIIRCFKAHYRRQFCLRAIEQDDAEEEDIYKINLIEAMVMAEQVWKSVSSTTIKNCWNHTEIQRPRLPTITLRPPRLPMPANFAAGWDIVIQFATKSWSVPEAHSFLQERLGDQYVASE